MKKNILISFSGGRTSAFMAKLIQENPKYKDHNKLFCFANTGKEMQQTLDFVDKCDKEFNLNLVWLEADVIFQKGKGTTYKIVDFETADITGKPFEDVIKKFGLPSKVYRHCTRDLKEYPIHKYAKQYFGSKDYVTAIGIRADEKHRLSADERKVYPLAELNIDERIIREFWDRQSFDLELKDYQGNCDICFLKSQRKKQTVIEENPESVKWWLDMENKYAKVDREIFDIYRDLSIEKLIELSNLPFRKAVDKHELRKQQNDIFDTKMDLEFDCFCKAN